MSIENLTPYSPKLLKRLMKEYGFFAKKKLGQNFLISQEKALQIVEFADIKRADTVIEIGIGFCALTLPLCEKAKEVIVFEIDARLIDVVKNNFSLPSNLKIINEDFLKTDLNGLSNGPKNRLKLVSNLPYSASSQILIKLLEKHTMFKSFTLTFQKELAQRVCAKEGSKTYGTLSILSSLVCDNEAGFEIPPDLFFPRPEITSTVINLSPKENPVLSEASLNPFGLFLRTLFQFRRKKILNTIKNALCLPSDDVLELLEESGIDSGIRLETLKAEDIYYLYLKICKKLPISGKCQPK